MRTEMLRLYYETTDGRVVNILTVLHDQHGPATNTPRLVISIRTALMFAMKLPSTYNLLMQDTPTPTSVEPLLNSRTPTPRPK
jgi:hypothetical protein